MDQKTIIFDFDGTIANTVEEGIRLFNQLAPSYGFKLITKENKEALRGKQPFEGLKELNIPLYKLAFIIGKMRNGLKAHIKSSPAYPEISEVLPELKRRGYYIAMLSSNTEENIWHFLENHGLAEYFDSINTATNIFGKARHITKLINSLNINPANVYYIGDEVRDMYAAKSAGVKAVGVTWGLNDRAILEKQTPAYVIDHPNELLEIFN
jgi:phosphoglycolate phosphatase